MEIRPFRGWRYCPGAQGDVSPFIAPPYDILSAEDKRRLLARSDRNIVAVDLPHVPPGEVGPDQAYRDASALLRSWQQSGVLVREPAATIYAYRQVFTWAGVRRVRQAVLCGVRATEFGKDVIPHERTFAGPKADRLKLTECTRMQLSPIFGFHRDPEGKVAAVLSAQTARAPDARGVLNDVEESLWAISDPRVIAEVASALRGVPVYIADGHHRYTTGLNYRDALKAAGAIGDDHEANFVLFALVARDDPGLLILPTHRMIRGLKEGFSVSRLAENAPQLAWESVSLEGVDLTDADAFLAPHGPGAMLLIGREPGEAWVARLRDPAAMAQAAPDQPEAWRRLDVAILHKLLIDQALAPWRAGEMKIEYTPDGNLVRQACRSGAAELGVCLHGTPLEAVEAIASAGTTMPHKSTYFYPKLATGMVLKPLE